MRLGVLADAHGNLAGLERCLHFLRQQDVEHYLFLGDATGYFPQNEAVCSLLDELPLTLIAGNHEGMLMGTLPMTAAMREIIQPPDAKSPAVERWLQRCAQAGPARDILLDGKHLHMVHGGPKDPWCGHIKHPEEFPRQDYDIILSGHTHRPHINISSTGRLHVNPGSCGYPRDNGAWLSVAILDTDDLQAQIFRLPNKLDSATLARLHPAVVQTLQRDFPATGIFVEEL